MKNHTLMNGKHDNCSISFCSSISIKNIHDYFDSFISFFILIYYKITITNIIQCLLNIDKNTMGYTSRFERVILRAGAMLIFSVLFQF